MKSLTDISRYPAGLPLVAENLLEFHAGRMLLLLLKCGAKGRIKGLTKLAKLDFFVRYPKLFSAASKATGKDPTTASTDTDSAMLRHHYGPWDPRYYQVLSYLESRDLIAIQPEGKSGFAFSLTPAGTELSKLLSRSATFQDVCNHMEAVKRNFGYLSGTALKRLIYDVFQNEVAELPLGETIQS